MAKLRIVKYIREIKLAGIIGDNKLSRTSQLLQEFIQNIEISNISRLDGIGYYIKFNYKKVSGSSVDLNDGIVILAQHMYSEFKIINKEFKKTDLGGLLLKLFVDESFYSIKNKKFKVLIK